MNFLKSLFFKSPTKKCGGCKFKQQETIGEFVSELNLLKAEICRFFSLNRSFLFRVHLFCVWTTGFQSGLYRVFSMFEQAFFSALRALVKSCLIQNLDC